jgi:peptidoglycan/LPS O-acetylase OafA/YrhL
VTEPIPYTISKRESLYLDLIRALAAFFVVLDHAPTLFDLPNAPRWGHQAVVVFFVLSGYVICNVADSRETNPRTFLIARLARLWSVLVPAMALTMVCDFVGRNLGNNPLAYGDVPHNLSIIRVSAVLIFLSETWVSIQPLSNQVVWSLCCEFWYYILFAAWTFIPPGPIRRLAIATAALLSGFKALLLLPIWLMGVALQRSQRYRRLSSTMAMAMYFGSLAVIVCILITHAYNPAIALMGGLVGPWISTQLAQARAFWLDWVLGLTIAAHLLGARGLAERMPLERFAKQIRWCAGISFAAYLFHLPLLHLCAAFLPKSAGLPAIGITLLAIALLGPRVERTKSWWHWALSWTVSRIPGFRPRPVAVS